MKQYQIKMAYNTILKLNNLQLPVKVAHDLYILRCSLEPHYQFAVERERALFQKCHGILKDDGSIVFKEKEDATKFYQELSEENETEISVNYDPVTIKYCSLEGCTLSPAEVASLDSIVIFE